MWCTRAVRMLPRHRLSRGSWRSLLSRAFALEHEWEERNESIAKLGLGGDYEWITAVQKKFVGGGSASAVDVDSAVCVASQSDQVADVRTILYRLRHTPNASLLLPSSEYALLRLLLRYEPESIFNLADDPINFGVFPNEHVACLFIDHFLEKKNIQGAARVATWVMQQEMTDERLLRLLCLYAAALWAELPATDQTLPDTRFHSDEEPSEDDIKTFKFPYLKNKFFDDHFDLTAPLDLVGKTLKWMSREEGGITQKDATLLAHVLRGQLEQALTLLSTDHLWLKGTVDIVKRNVTMQLAKVGEGEEPPSLITRLNEKLESVKMVEGKLSASVLVELEKVRAKEEEKMATKQKRQFAEWNERRLQLVKAQADRLLMKTRLEELEAEEKALDDERRRLFFFDNRLAWERAAKENEEIELHMKSISKVVDR